MSRYTGPAYLIIYRRIGIENLGQPQVIQVSIETKNPVFVGRGFNIFQRYSLVVRAGTDHGAAEADGCGS